MSYRENGVNIHQGVCVSAYIQDHVEFPYFYGGIFFLKPCEWLRFSPFHYVN